MVVVDAFVVVEESTVVVGASVVLGATEVVEAVLVVVLSALTAERKPTVQVMSPTPSRTAAIARTRRGSPTNRGREDSDAATDAP